MFCSQCGSENDDAVSFCKTCGVSLQVTSPRMVSFKEAISLAFNNYANFRGRATRAEYWWFVLLCTLVSVLLMGIDSLGTGGFLNVIWGLGTLIPSLSLGFRRLHDTNKPGYWSFIWIGGLLAFIILNTLGAGGVGGILFIASFGALVFWFAQPSDKGPNNYGMGKYTKLD